MWRSPHISEKLPRCTGCRVRPEPTYYYYAGTKEWSLQILQIPDLHNADITDGMAPTLPAREANGGQSGFTKVGSWILNNV